MRTRAEANAPALGDPRRRRRDPGAVAGRPAKRLLPAGADLGAAVGGAVAGLEHPVAATAAISRSATPCSGVSAPIRSRSGMLWFHLTPWVSIPLAARGRRRRRGADRLSDLPPARPLFRAGDARLSAGDLYVFQWLGYQELALPMKREAPASVHAVRRSARLCRAGAGAAGDRAADLAVGREFAVRHGADRDQAERAGRRGRRHQHLALEDAGADAVGRARRGRRRAVRGRAAGRHPGKRVRHAGLGAGADPGAVRRGRQPVGAGDRRGGAGAAGRGAQRRTRRVLPGIQGVVYGVAIIAIILLAPEGVYWRVLDRLSRRRARDRGAARGRLGADRGRIRAANVRAAAAHAGAARAPICWCCAISASRSAGCARSTGSTSSCPRAGFTASSARTAPARRRCSTSSTGF